MQQRTAVGSDEVTVSMKPQLFSHIMQSSGQVANIVCRNTSHGNSTISRQVDTVVFNKSLNLQ